MATLLTNRASVQTTPTSSNILESGVLTPRVHVIDATYTVTAAEVANDVIRIVKLPAGSKVIPHLSQIDNDAVGGTSAIVTVGDLDTTAAGVDASDADRYGAALDITAAGKDLFDSGTRGVASNTPYALQSESWITATFSTLTAAPTAGKVITFRIAYSK